MNRMTVKSKVGGDGVLHLTLPVGPLDANQEVLVTVEPINGKHAMEGQEWQAWVESMAGSWQGDFERPPQGEYELRDPLS
jgi:hypothetical protein